MLACDPASLDTLSRRASMHSNASVDDMDRPQAALLLPCGDLDLTRYESRSDVRAWGQLITTVVPFLILWIAAWASLEITYWLTLLLAFPTGALLVRLFVIQHDCGHHSLFRSRLANRAAGRVISILTFVPFEQWRRSHAIHHANSGNLDRRGIGDVRTLTVEEYCGMSSIRRLAYRVYRSPIVMFGLGGIYLILLKQRVPFGPRRRGRWWWASSQLTNLAIGISVSAICWAIGLEAFIAVHTLVFCVYITIGVWLFYAEHQFENTYWRSNDEWGFREAGLAGSSYLALPRPLQWLTANIGIHHVHHLNTRIPNYRLQECIDAHPDLAGINRLSLRQLLHATRLSLWDVKQRRLVSFRNAGDSMV